MKTRLKRSPWLALLSGITILAGCDSDNDNNNQQPPPPPPAMATFEVTVTNFTNAQPLSPVAVVAHTDGYSTFSVGDPASAGLELMAEGGDNSMLLAEADADANVLVSASGAAPIAPAASETVTIEVLEAELPGLLVSVSTMLVNTNDAITALDSMSVASLAPGESVSRRTIAYDAGTEANSELAGDIPGPAGGGEGFNAARDDIADRVAMHAGVVGQDDGFAASALSGQHRFDNPVAEVTIERVN